jgi:DNA-binding response OmpR family regulator
MKRAKTILLADDETSQRQRMKHLLRNMGYQVIESRDYSEASALYQRHSEQIDLLVVDVSLPGFYGCELARTALATNPRVTALLLSAMAGAEACKFYGFVADDVHFLKKPFRDSDLMARVQYLLEAAEPPAQEASSTSA